jgi:O-antigen ligase
MNSTLADQTIGKLLWIGTPAISLFLLVSTVTDPVNSTKLFIAGGVAWAVLAVVLTFRRRILLSEEKITTAFVVLFLIAAISAVFNSSSPFNQNFYGQYGRNTGFLTHLFLGILLLGASTMRERRNFPKLLLGLAITGGVNLAYCTWVLAFGDFLGWNNPYGTILGLFGNPDFISAFFGMFATLLMAFFFKPNLQTKYRLGLVLFILLTVFEIRKSHAIQGLVVTAGGACLVGFYVLWTRNKSRVIPAIYSVFILGIATLALLGTLQKGPFSFVYKRSVSFRGTYWKTGINMGIDHPLTGVGMDSYGDWYRRERPAVAFIDTPGVKTISNVAHNVYVDMFASGGFPLLITNIGLTVLTMVSIVSVTFKLKNFDWVFVAMSCVWICYQVQSIISINQIGLAVWGWVLSGALIAYSRIVPLDSTDKQEVLGSKRKNSKTQQTIISPQLVAGLGFLVGLLIAVPPLAADMKWRQAIQSRSLATAEAALVPSYLNPSDSYRFADAVDTLMGSNLNDQALKYTLQAVDFNPDYFTAWRMLYLLPNSSDQQKTLAMSNMRRLDPNNPDVVNN